MNCKTLILIVCVIVGISGTPVPGKGSRKIGPAYYEKSSRDCSAQGDGYGLPVYQGDKNIKRIEKALSDHQMIKTWLPLKRRKFDVWTWVDGKPVEHNFAQQPWRNYMDCGLFHNRDKAVEVDNCTLDHFGYVCEFNGTCAGCGESQSSCIDHKGRALVYGCSVDNWYDARYQCKRKGMDLAIIRDPETKKVIHDQWYVSNRKQCYLLWIGLRREDWVYNSTGVTDNKSFKPYWAPGHLNKTHDCAIIAKDAQQNHFLWRSSICNAERHALCLQNQEYEFVTPKPTQASGPSVTIGAPPAAKSGNKAGLALGLIFLFLILIVAGIAVYKRKWIMGKVETFRKGNTTEEEKEPLHTIPQLPPFTERFDSSGGSYHCPDYDVTLDVPAGALAEEAEITVKPNMNIPEFVHSIPQGHVMIAPVTEIRGTCPLNKFINATVKHSVVPEMKQEVNVYERFWDSDGNHGEWSKVTRGQNEDKSTYYEVFSDKLVFYMHKIDASVELLCTCRIDGSARLSLKAAVFADIKNTQADKKKSLEVQVHTFIFHSFYTITSLIKEQLENEFVDPGSSFGAKSSEEESISKKEEKPVVIHAADLQLTTPLAIVEAHDQMEIAVFPPTGKWEILGSKSLESTVEKLLNGPVPWLHAATFKAEPTHQHQAPGDFSLEYKFVLHKPDKYEGPFNYPPATTNSTLNIPVTMGLPISVEKEGRNHQLDDEFQSSVANELKEQPTKDTSAADVPKKDEENPYDTIDLSKMDPTIGKSVGTGKAVESQQGSKKVVEKQGPEEKVIEITKKGKESVSPAVPTKRPNSEEQTPTPPVKSADTESTSVMSEEIGREGTENTGNSEKTIVRSASGGDETDKPEHLAGLVTESKPDQGKPKRAKETKAEKKMEKERKKKVEKEQKEQREREKKEEKERVAREKKETKEQREQRERDKKEEKERAAREKKEKKQQRKVKTAPQPDVNEEQKEEGKEVVTTGLQAVTPI